VTQRFSRYVRIALWAAVLGGLAAPSFAQTPADDDAAVRPLEPDFRVINLPTTLPLPVHGGDFELTHRFGGNWRGRSVGDLASDLFGIDESATINFGYRFGLAKHVEVAASRTNFDRTIQMQGKYDAFHQSEGRPLGISAIVSVEGANNFRDDYAPAFGLSLSRTFARRAVLYVDPFFVHNTAATTGVNRDTGFVGIGGRLRLTRTSFVVAELSPRVGGYDPGQTMYGFAIEKRVGGHVFQLNWSNSTSGATYAQIARGGTPNGLFLGFNLSRKFY